MDVNFNLFAISIIPSLPTLLDHFDKIFGFIFTVISTVVSDELSIIDLTKLKMKDLDLKVEKQKIVAQSPKHRLCTYLPHEVDDQKGNAKWDGKKDRLSITLPIVRGGLF